MNHREKKSLGIACCRLSDTGRPEILMVRKRYTYAYNAFVHGRYNASDTDAMIKLFNGMTVDEKRDLLSLNFMQIWYRVWLNFECKVANYFSAKNKFETAFMSDDGVRLRRLIAKSTHAETIWEIPKGRKSHRQEYDIHCAIREFFEETGITKKQYRIFPNVTKTYSYIDEGVKYTNTYFVATPCCNIEPRIDFNHPEQLTEISDIRWMNIDEIRLVDNTKLLANFIRPIFNYVKKRVKVIK